MSSYYERPPRTARTARKVWDLATDKYGSRVRGIFFQPSVSVWGAPAWGIDVEGHVDAHVFSEDLETLHEEWGHAHWSGLPATATKW